MRFNRATVMGLLLGLAGLLLVSGCQSAPMAKAPARDGVFIHLKTGPDHPHSVLMALRMAQMMSTTQDVMVYVDVDGIGAVLSEGQDLAMEPFGSSHAMVKDLLSRGVPIYACPGCLKAKGKTADQLIPGVKVAEKKAFFDFTKGRILTLDY